MNNRIGIGAGKDQDKYLISISDDDVLAAMKKIGGYLDITFGDFKELYHVACCRFSKKNPTIISCSTPCRQMAKRKGGRISPTTL